MWLFCVNFSIYQGIIVCFHLEACHVYKNLTKGSHNFSIDVKVTKNVGGPNCLIIAIFFFITSQNNQVNYVSLLNHDNLGMIWKYYLSLIYLVLEKRVKFHHIISISHLDPIKPMTFCMETSTSLEKRLELLVEKSFDLWSNFHWTICWYELDILKKK
jgi:hypothetical protein